MLRLMSLIEFLEPRQHFSVSAVTLAGPLTIGTTWHYSDGSTTTVEELASIDCLQLVNTYYDRASVINAGDVTNTQEVALDSRRGFIERGYDYSNTPELELNEEVFSPPELLFPPKMVAGHAYHTRFVATEINTGEGTGKVLESDAVTLVSDQLKSVTVPAGTFSAYEINDADSGTEWYAPGVGLIETDSLSLTSYSIAGNPSAGQLVPYVVSSSLPANVVSGSTIHAAVGVMLRNLGSAPESGLVTTRIYASDSNNSIDSSSILLGSVTTDLSLSLDGGRAVHVPITMIPANLNSSYAIVAQTTDVAGNAVTAQDDFGYIKIGPAIASLDSFFVKASAYRVVPGSGYCIITVSNDGNIRSLPSGQIELFVPGNNEDDLFDGATPLYSQTVHLNLAPGESRNYVLRFDHAVVKAISQQNPGEIATGVTGPDAGMPDAFSTPF